MLRDRNLIPMSHDHQRALGLCVLTERSLHADASVNNVMLLAKRIMEAYESEIGVHFAVEEKVLFPTLSVFPGLAPLIAELTAEHREIEALVAAMREGPGQTAVEAFCKLLPPHIRKEERLLFEQAQGLLSSEQMERLGERLASERKARAGKTVLQSR
jgi:hemerythrin-like domain-containing protein